MSATCDELKAFRDRLKKITGSEKNKFLEDCTKELAARLLNKVVKRTPTDTGNLRRGWTAANNNNSSNFNVVHMGNSYVITVKNSVDYASYVEYGHRTADHSGWVNGKFMLTISEQELEQSSPAILEAKLDKWLKDAFR